MVPASYHDDWLIESLANYSALLLLERRKGIKAVDAVLDDYRTHLLTKTDAGRTLDSAGPIVWGYRLESSLAPDAWRDGHLRKRHLDHSHAAPPPGRREISRVAARQLPAIIIPSAPKSFAIWRASTRPNRPIADLKIFFDNWIYGTGDSGCEAVLRLARRETVWNPCPAGCRRGLHRLRARGSADRKQEPPSIGLPTGERPCRVFDCP